MATRSTSGVQIVKGGSGDMMMIVPIDKKTVAKLKDQKVVVAFGLEIDMNKFRGCPNVYTPFKLREELVQKPVARIK
jgi:hypothetical protein